MDFKGVVLVMVGRSIGLQYAYIPAAAYPHSGQTTLARDEIFS